MYLATAPTNSARKTAMTAAQASRLVIRAAARRYEQARRVHEALEAAFVRQGETDRVLGYHQSAACQAFAEAERALINAILSTGHADDLDPRDNYGDTAHEPHSFACDGRVYLVEADPAQDLEVGEEGWAGPAMILIVGQAGEE